MNNIHTKAKEFEQVFISIEKTIELILSSFKDEQSEHTQNIMNKRFFKNQTCLAKDGYDLDNILITDDSTPSYTDFKNAILGKIAGVDNPLLHEYGFSKKRTLENLQNLGVSIPSELTATAKSFVQDDDYCDDTGAYYECLPYEYALLYRDHEKALARIRELKALKAVDDGLTDNERRGYLATIGILLELMQKKKYTSQTQIINDITSHNLQGQKQRTLEERFSQANQTLADIRKI